MLERKSTKKDKMYKETKNGNSEKEKSENDDSENFEKERSGKC